MFSKKEKNETFSDKNYEKAKKNFLDFYSSMAARLHTWKLMSFLLLILTIIPYVIEVDETGNAKGINPAYQINYDPGEANIQYYLKEFVNNSRWLSSDTVLQGNFYQSAIAFLTTETKEKYNQIVKGENWTEMIKNGFTRDVQIESINKVAGTNNSYQIRWVENVYNKGTLIDTKRILGIFSIKIEQPRNLEELQQNPLGIKISDYHISNEK